MTEIFPVQAKKNCLQRIIGKSAFRLEQISISQAAASASPAILALSLLRYRSPE
jgi:hypothetical protein